MATLNFPWAQVEEFFQCKNELEELWMKKGHITNFKFVEEKLKTLKWKKAMFHELCKEEFSKEDIVSEEEETEFDNLYLEKRLEMNNFLNKVVEWVALRKRAAEKNKSYVSSSQMKEKHVTIKSKISKNPQCSYARMKLEEMKAKFEAERSVRTKNLSSKIVRDTYKNKKKSCSFSKKERS